MTVALTAVVTALFFIAVVILSSRASRRRSAALSRIARDLDWADVRVSTFLTMKVRGMRNGVSVSIAHKPRQKSTPERVVTVMKAPASGRLIVRRRVGGFPSNRPWFGPPMFDHPEFWIRSDDRMTAQRFLDNRQRLALVGRNLATRFDEMRLDAHGIRIERAVERSGWGFDEAALRRVAMSEWELALAMSRT